MDVIDDVLKFWFGDLQKDPFATEKMGLWFASNAQIDAEMRQRFGAEVERAANGEYDPLRGTPRGHLALIVLLDQFPRNIFRRTPRAFAHDPRALNYALEMIDHGTDQELSLIERSFVYLPLEHAEDAALQQRSVELFEKLVSEAPPERKAMFESMLDYAERHKVIIDRFGRFPHRNAILGRESSAEELEFLEQPGSSF
ncbi:MAG: DUF924 domain-containing protein [Bradymonadaceae bacterium]|nr:DUF924 domain-containing protein [Lujinxingiaceae bacterium]